MANVPDTEYWSVDGHSLQTYAYNIESWGGSRQAPPKFRGSNVVVPHRAGETYKRKTVDSRVITLAMWVVGANTDGIPGNRRLFESNWRMLRRLLWTPNRQVTLTKVFYDDVSNSVITASADAQFSDGLDSEMTGTSRAAFTVDLLLADPYFYSGEITQSFSGSRTFAALGDADTQRIRINFSGGTNPRLTNTTKGIWTQWTGSAGGGVDLNSYNFTAVQGSTNVISGITHDGAYEWMRIGPDGDSLTLSGGGSASVTYAPAWL